jgi:hypothetical protein
MRGCRDMVVWKEDQWGERKECEFHGRCTGGLGSTRLVHFILARLEADTCPTLNHFGRWLAREHLCGMSCRHRIVRRGAV